MIEVCKVMRFPAWQLHVLPADTPWTLAVLAEPLATACKAVRLVAWLKSAAAELLAGLQPSDIICTMKLDHDFFTKQK